MTVADDDETELLVLAKEGDSAAFDQLVAPYWAELHAHCYRFDEAGNDEHPGSHEIPRLPHQEATRRNRSGLSAQ